MTIKPNASHQSLSETTVIIHASTEPTEMSIVTMGSIFFLICIRWYHSKSTLKSVQVMVRLHIFPIFSFLAKCCHLSAEMTTFLPEMKISEKYASGP